MNREHLYWLLIPALAFALADLIVVPLETPPTDKPVSTATAKSKGRIAPAPVAEVARLLQTSASTSNAPQPAPEREVEENEPSVALPPGLSLQGTMAGAAGQGIAFFQTASGPVILSSGDISPDQTFQLLEVNTENVLLSSGTREMRLSVGQKIENKTVAKPQPSTSQTPLTQDEIRQLVEDPSQLRGLKANPYYEQGKMVGVVLKLPSNHPLTRLQLQSGDLVKSINQRPIDNPGALSSLIPLLRNSSTLVIEIERSGRPEKLVVEVN